MHSEQTEEPRTPPEPRTPSNIAVHFLLGAGLGLILVLVPISYLWLSEVGPA